MGYTVNDNLNLAVGYKSMVNDKAPGDLSMGSLAGQSHHTNTLIV